MNRRHLLAFAGVAGLSTALGARSQGPVRSAASTFEFASASNAMAPRPLPPVDPRITPVVEPIICRDAWRALPALPGGVAHTLTRMTIHHTGAVLGDNRNAPGRLRQHQQLHQNERGWSDIAYHVGVDRNGNIYELRFPLVRGDTATEYDTTGHFLVLSEGDFDQETVTPQQLRGAAVAFAWAAQTFKIDPAMLGSHRDFAATACPGSESVRCSDVGRAGLTH